MRIRITLKDPDGVDYGLDGAVDDTRPEGLDEYEWEELKAGRREKISEELSRWVEYGEYVRIEFDTDAGTATVLPTPT